MTKTDCTYIVCTVAAPLDLSKTTAFEWDQGNVSKSYKKHGVTIQETEKLFLDEDLLLLEDIKHSQKEARFIAIGKTRNEILFAAFALRQNKIRVISARPASKKERKQYEEKT